MTPSTDQEPYAATPPGLLAHAAQDPAEQLAVQHARRRRRHQQRLAALGAAFLVFLGIAALAAQVVFSDAPARAGDAPKLAVNADAAGIVLLRPGHDPERLARALPVSGSSTRADAAHATYELPGVATVSRATANARLALGSRSARAQAAAEQISLFDGRIQLDGASMIATSEISGRRAGGALELADTATLTVDGVERPAAANERIAVEGIGTVIVNEQAVLSSAPTGDAQTGPRHRVVGALVHVRLSAETSGLPAGTELIIGRVDAGVRQGKVRAVATPPRTAASRPATPPGIQAGVPKPGDAQLPRRATAVRGKAGAAPVASLQGYVFPVLGNASFTNDWGAPRASTGIPHQGTDIFAAMGTPIVAISDGVLDRVGWNAIGGYRFWLFDQYGNAFYHAHLSAYSPLARDGARVKRGDVIGFVGDTGDAKGTPPHLHFEVHPGNGGPVNPFPFLGAWQKGIAVAIGVAADAAKEQVAPLALLGFSDIAANSGLAGDVMHSVPDTTHRPIEHEHAPQPTDETLTGAIEGPGTSG